ncbi:hypothetical protein GCM10010411_72790 [Actinomadura fulvescens]|uniref:Uncharacterized protein n=1 Tax=Actinomadura fulvescens TaxID=46160 RepID=A0ABP6CUP2_9ACTN
MAPPGGCALGSSAPGRAACAPLVGASGGLRLILGGCLWAWLLKQYDDNQRVDATLGGASLRAAV